MTVKRNPPKAWSQKKTGGKKESLSLNKLFPNMVKLTPKFKGFRMLESTTSFAMHTIKFTNDKDEVKTFKAFCFAYNSNTEEFEDSKNCPACRSNDKEISRASIGHLVNVIDREYQEEIGEKLKKSEKSIKNVNGTFKDPEDKVKSPVRLLRLPSGQVGAIKEIGTLNKHKIDGKSKQFEVDHPKHGLDILIKFDDKKAGAEMYNSQKGDATSLTKYEKEYLLYDTFSTIPNYTNASELYADEKKDLEESLKRLGLLGKSKKKDEEDEEEDEEDSDDNDFDDEDEEDNKKSKKKKKKKSSDDDEDDDEEDNKKSKKKKSKKDDDEDEDDEDEEEDEDSEDDDDDDFDDEDEEEDEDDEEDDKKSKKSKKKTSKKSKKDDDDEDEEEDDEEEDEEDDDDEDFDSDEDDDEDDEDDDEDEEEEKSSKKSKDKKKNKSKDKKKKSKK